MQSLAKKNSRHLRRFKVGIVGASDNELDVIKRIFTVTRYRTRYYEPIKLHTNQYHTAVDVDFILICSGNPNVVNAWEKCEILSTSEPRPMIYLSRSKIHERGKYQLSSPVNPGKLIKLLDHYTIKELNFFPEFEIGHETQSLEDIAASGIQLLRSSPSKSTTTEKGHRSCALVVDDSLAVRKQMQIEFELINNDLDVVESAEAAMDAVQRKRYDIIFLDVVMPGMDGYAACKQIKRCPLNKNTPVIMLTSRSSSFDKIKGTLAGCSAYLVKPINHNEFEQVYNKHVIKTSEGRANVS